jgi:hypothetical protein
MDVSDSKCPPFGGRRLILIFILHRFNSMFTIARKNRTSTST